MPFKNKNQLLSPDLTIVLPITQLEDLNQLSNFTISQLPIPNFKSDLWQPIPQKAVITNPKVKKQVAKNLTTLPKLKPENQKSMKTKLKNADKKKFVPEAISSSQLELNIKTTKAKLKNLRQTLKVAEKRLKSDSKRYYDLKKVLKRVPKPKLNRDDLNLINNYKEIEFNQQSLIIKLEEKVWETSLKLEQLRVTEIQALVNQVESINTNYLSTPAPAKFNIPEAELAAAAEQIPWNSLVSLQKDIIAKEEQKKQSLKANIKVLDRELSWFDEYSKSTNAFFHNSLIQQTQKIANEKAFQSQLEAMTSIPVTNYHGQLDQFQTEQMVTDCSYQVLN